MAINFPLFVPLTLLDRFTRPLAQVGGALDGFARKAGQVGKRLTVGVTVPLTAFGALSVRAGLDFQRSLNRVQAITGATAEQMAGLSAQAQGALGPSGLPSSARGAAAAMVELARSGQDVLEVQRTLPGVLDLARAAYVGEAEAAKATADVLDVYKLEATESARVTDLLAFGANRSQQEFDGLSAGVVAAGQTAVAFQQDLESTVAVLDVLADANVEGAAGAALLERALTSLARPTATTARAFARLRVSRADLFRDDGQLRNFDEILANLSARGATAADAVDLFGKRSGVKLAALLGPGATRVRAFAEELRGAGGAASDLARVALAGGVGTLEEFTVRWERLLVTVARSGLIEALGALAERASDLLRRVSALDPRVVRFGITLGGIAAVAGPALVGLANLTVAVQGLARAYQLLRAAQAAPGGLAGTLLGRAVPWVAIAGSVASIAGDLIELFRVWRGSGSEPAAGGPLIDRPALDAGAFPGSAALGRDVGPERLGAAAAEPGARARVGGTVRVEFENVPRGTRVSSRRTGDVPLDVDVGYNLAAGLAG